MNSKKFLLILSLLFFIIIFSGCISKPANYYLEIERVDDEGMLSMDYYSNFMNITTKDMTPYPTLQEALDQYTDPNITINVGILLEISNEEQYRIFNILLKDENNNYYEVFAYYDKIYRIEVVQAH